MVAYKCGKSHRPTNASLADGVVEFRTAIPSKQVAQWTDPIYDMGNFAASKSHACSWVIT